MRESASYRLILESMELADLTINSAPTAAQFPVKLDVVALASRLAQKRDENVERGPDWWSLWLYCFVDIAQAAVMPFD